VCHEKEKELNPPDQFFHFERVKFQLLL